MGMKRDVICLDSGKAGASLLLHGKSKKTGKELSRESLSVNVKVVFM